MLFLKFEGGLEELENTIKIETSVDNNSETIKLKKENKKRCATLANKKNAASL